MISTVNFIVDFLNQVNKLDPNMIDKLINNRVVCNAKIANHPDIQVIENDKKETVVGLLGLFNGLISAFHPEKYLIYTYGFSVEGEKEYKLTEQEKLQLGFSLVNKKDYSKNAD